MRNYEYEKCISSTFVKGITISFEIHRVMIKLKCIINAKVLLEQKRVFLLASLIIGSISIKKIQTAMLIAVELIGATTNVGVVNAQGIPH